MSDIKDYFISRYNPGIIMEADFSQLEVIYLAHVTKDPVLFADIISGMDMHRVRAAELFGVPQHEVTKEQRKTAKAFSFMLQYGAGANHMSEVTGHPVELAQTFIHNYYARYRGVKQWQDKTLTTVEQSAYPTTLKSPQGMPVKRGTYKSETGRKYVFTQGDAPEWMKRAGKKTSFKPTEIKNYPIQGGATGDIVPMVLGKLNRWLAASEYHEVKLIATIHDSIILDMPSNLCYTIGNGVKRIMEDAPNIYKDTFGIDFDLPLKAEIKYGPTWGKCDTVLT